MIKVGVYGASGYTGYETINLLRKHPEVELIFATSEKSAGQGLADIYPITWDIPLVSAAMAPLHEVDAVFCCLPHRASMPAVIAARQANVRVIDLSADFRLADVAVYQQWYNVSHEAPELLKEAVYGLTELNRAEIAEANLVACPGCYPTSVLLALYPLLANALLDTTAPLIADSKSGISGAGRKPSLKTLFSEANENLSPYSIGKSHRHVPEMGAIINQLGGDSQRLIFSPHLVPLNRGMFSTIYVTLNEDSSDVLVHEQFQEIYANQPMVHVLPLGQLATITHTQNSNQAVISITAVSPRHFILCSSIDNLGKGASGQAVQNFNIMFGLEETMGIQ